MNDNNAKINKGRSFWEKGRTWYFSIIVNVIVFVMMMLMFHTIFYNGADDFMINITYGPQNPHLVFSNFLIGEVLVVLTHLIPGFAWYTYVQLLLILVALTGIGHVILERSYSAMGKIVLFVVVAFLGYEGYVTPGYMRVAITLTSAGMLMLVNSLIQGKKLVTVNNILAVVLIILGSMYSFKIFICSLIINIILTVIYIIVDKRHEIAESFEKRGKRIIQYAIVVIAVTLVSTGLYAIDCLEYKNIDETETILEYRDSYEKLLSYGYNSADEDINWESFNRLYKKAKAKVTATACGIEAKDVEKVLAGLEEISSNAKELSVDTALSYFKVVPVRLFSVDIFYLWFALTIVMLAFSNVRAKVIIPSAVTLLIGAFIIYMTYSDWAYYVLFIPASLPMLLSTEKIEKGDWRITMAFVVVFFVILYSVFGWSLNT